MLNRVLAGGAMAAGLTGGRVGAGEPGSRAIHPAAHVLVQAHQKLPLGSVVNVASVADWDPVESQDDASVRPAWLTSAPVEGQPYLILADDAEEGEVVRAAVSGAALVRLATPGGVVGSRASPVDGETGWLVSDEDGPAVVLWWEEDPADTEERWATVLVAHAGGGGGGSIAVHGKDEDGEPASVDPATRITFDPDEVGGSEAPLYLVPDDDHEDRVTVKVRDAGSGQRGIVSATTQTFSGEKTFEDATYLAPVSNPGYYSRDRVAIGFDGITTRYQETYRDGVLDPGGLAHGFVDEDSHVFRVGGLSLTTGGLPASSDVVSTVLTLSTSNEGVTADPYIDLVAEATQSWVWAQLSSTRHGGIIVEASGAFVSLDGNDGASATVSGLTFYGGIYTGGNLNYTTTTTSTTVIPSVGATVNVDVSDVSLFSIGSPVFIGDTNNAFFGIVTALPGGNVITVENVVVLVGAVAGVIIVGGEAGPRGPRGPAGPNQITIGTTGIVGGTVGRVLMHDGFDVVGEYILDVDGTLANNSDTRIPSQKAVKTYVDAAVTGLLDLKGGTDCSADPNYPVALKGDAYYVTVAGKIGGAAGVEVDVGDLYFAIADNAGGNQAAVGADWRVLEHNLEGALLSANNLADLLDASDSRDNLGLGDAAVEFIGTSGDNVPLLSGVNSWSGAQTFLNSSGVKILDTDASHTLGLVGGSNLSADRTLTVTTGDASREVTLSGDLTVTATADVQNYVHKKDTGNIASAATTDLATVAGDFVHVTGTTTITAFGTVAAGVRKYLVFDASLTLTHNATSLILPTGASLLTAANDMAIMVSEGSGNWRCVNYSKAVGTALKWAYSDLDGICRKYFTATASTTSNTLQNAMDSNGNALSFTIGANEVWVIECYLPITAAATAGTKVGLSGPSSPTDVRLSVFGNSNSATAFLHNALAAFSSATAGAFCVNQAGFIKISGTITNGSNAGTIQIQFQSNINGQTSTLARGSNLMAWRIG